MVSWPVVIKLFDHAYFSLNNMSFFFINIEFWREKEKINLYRPRLYSEQHIISVVYQRRKATTSQIASFYCRPLIQQWLACLISSTALICLCTVFIKQGRKRKQRLLSVVWTVWDCSRGLFFAEVTPDILEKVTPRSVLTPRLFS